MKTGLVDYTIKSVMFIGQETRSSQCLSYSKPVLSVKPGFQDRLSRNAGQSIVE